MQRCALTDCKALCRCGVMPLSNKSGMHPGTTRPSALAESTGGASRRIEASFGLHPSIHARAGAGGRGRARGGWVGARHARTLSLVRRGAPKHALSETKKST
eukprot:4703387-Prymnesium_polylepis.1